MRRWWLEARTAAARAADEAGLWLPGALAWALTVGWIPLVAVVARPPSVTDLTFIGARIYTAGAWPWNAVLAVGGAVLLVIVGFVLVALAEAALLDRRRGALDAGSVATLVGIGFTAAAPTLAAMLATGTAAIVIAIREFTAPGPADAMFRTLARLAPFLVAVALAWAAGTVFHAAASRNALLGRARFVEAVTAAPRRLASAGVAAAVHGIALVVLRAAYLGFTAILLGVLWEPIATRLPGGAIDVATAPLLVGFVAIWLCLVLGGGALHAWGSLTWTGVLGPVASGGVGAGRHATGGADRR